MTDKLRKSQAQERRVAAAAGAVLQPRSGAGWSRKNDSRSAEFLIENKRTDNRRSITIHAKDLEALRTNAIRSSRRPALQFDLNGRSYVIVPEEDFDWGDSGH